MKNHAQISPITIGKTVTISGITTEVLAYLHLTAITTKQMAEFYGCGSEVILNNFNNNRDRFIEGEHFINITGNSNWSKIPTNLISPNDPTPMLWTFKGAACHASLLATEKAFDVFRQLETSYFNEIDRLEQTGGIINYLHLSVITTKQMADFYDCAEEVILRNFNNNRDIFIEGEHFINITGNDSLSKIPTNLISPNDNTPMLWLFKGAAFHARMLANEKALEVFEKLANEKAWEVFEKLVTGKAWFGKDIEADGRVLWLW